MDVVLTAPGTAVRLEAAFGDPADGGGPLPYRAVIAADERRELPQAGVRLLEQAGLEAEFVPRELGGRFERADALIRALRPVFRRDGALALAHPVDSFVAAVGVWHAGTPEQRAATAALLLDGGRLAVAYPELAHANRVTRNRIRIRPAGGRFTAVGDKPVVWGGGRADALVVFGRTDSGTDGHAALLVETAGLPAGTLRPLSRPAATGLRGRPAAALRFDGRTVPGAEPLGTPGEGLALALWSFRLTRAVIPAMALGIADTALRVTTGFALAHEQLARTGPRGRRIRSLLGTAFVDLLLCDCLALVAARALHLLPGQADVYAAAVEYLLPKLLTETAQNLSVMPGGRIYDRDGDHAILRKALRDLPAVVPGHAGSAACQITVLPWLARAAHPYAYRTQAPDALFRPGAELPPLRLDGTGTGGGTDMGAVGDPLAATLIAADGDTALPPRLRALVAELADELRRLGRAGLREGAAADPHGLALADRYMLLLAAASVVGVWRHGGHAPGDFLADPSWAVAALARIVRRLGRTVPAGPPDERDPVDAETLARFDRPRSYDLDALPLYGGTP